MFGLVDTRWIISGLGVMGVPGCGSLGFLEDHENRPVRVIICAVEGGGGMKGNIERDLSANRKVRLNKHIFKATLTSCSLVFSMEKQSEVCKNIL